MCALGADSVETEATDDPAPICTDQSKIYAYYWCIHVHVHADTGTGKVRVSRDDVETDRGDANSSGSGRGPSEPLLPSLNHRKFSPTSAGIMLYMYM